MEELIKHRREVEWPSVLELVKEFVAEFQPDFRAERRKEYLQKQIQEVRTEFFKECRILATRKDELTHWSVKNLEWLERRLNKLNLDVKILVGKREGFQPETIVRARQYPITSILPTRNGMAHCPFHKDRHPSMDVRKNFYFCYSCGASGDVIDLVMKLNHVTFTQAINTLS